MIQSITYQDDTTEIACIPRHFYQVQYQTSTINRSDLVVMFDLSFRTHDKHIHCTIPYYVSDGHTNKFRANILFPFLCFTSREPSNNCPMSSMYSMASLKLRLIHTLNDQFVHTFINSQYRELLIHKQLYIDELETETELSLIEKSNQLYQLITNRLGNIIDLLISLAYISDTEIENLLQDPALLLPIFGNEEDKYNLTKKANVNVDENNIYILYRKSILLFFKYIKTHIISKGFRYTGTYLPIESITRSEFNNIMNTCGGEESAQLNLRHYNVLSFHMYEFCKAKRIFMDSIGSVLSHGIPSVSPYTPLLRESILDYMKTYAQSELELVNKSWKSTCEPYKKHQEDLELERQELERQELERQEIERKELERHELERQREEQIKEEMFLERIRKPYDVAFDLDNTSLFPWPLSLFGGDKKRSYNKKNKKRLQRKEKKSRKSRLHRK